MICLLIFICCLTAAISLAAGVMLKSFNSLVEAFLDIAAKYGMILIGAMLFFLALFVLASAVIEFMNGGNILLILLGLVLWLIPLGLLAFFATLIGSIAYLVLGLICCGVMLVSGLIGELFMSLFSGMLGIMAKQSKRR
ncbi:MAG: hypothetical protein LUH04_08815 [Clostridium sp.]|nr:hypothetical protein [Clostridium sp.]